MVSTTATTALIVVTYGSADLVERNLAGVALASGEQGGGELVVIIVDSFTDHDERARVEAMCSRQGWLALTLDTNAGFGGGVNRGAEVALSRGAEVIVALNPDARLADGALDQLVAAARENSRSLIAPRIERPDGSLWTEGTDLYLDDGSMAGVRHRAARGAGPRMFWVSGACSR